MTSSSPVGDRAAVLDLVLDDPDAGDRAVLALAEDLDRAAQEAQVHAALVAVRLALGVLAHQVDVALVGRVALGLEPVRAELVELHVGRVDDDVRARELAQLAQLGRGEGGLRRAAAAEHDHLVDLGRGQRLDRVVGGVGGRDLLGVEHEHAGDVDRDVAVADHDRAGRAEVELVVGVVRVAVVPGHELERAVAAGPVLAGDAELVVGRGADRVEHDVVAVEQVLAAHVAAELDAPVEAEAGVLRGLLVDARDALDLGVIRRHAGAYEPERGRQDLQQVDLEAGLQQLVCGVEAGRSGAHDRGTQGGLAHMDLDPRSSAIEGTRKTRIRNVSTSRPSATMKPTWNRLSSSVASSVQNVPARISPALVITPPVCLEAADHVLLLADPGDQEDVVVHARARPGTRT